MGVFLDVACAVGVSPQDLRSQVEAQLNANGGVLERPVEGMEWEDTATLMDGESGACLIFAADVSAQFEISQEISKTVDTPFIHFHIHDGDFWCFYVYQGGEEKMKFSTMPDYWEDFTPEQMAEWIPDPQAVADLVPGIEPEALAPYLIHWSTEFESEEDELRYYDVKAHPDDEHARSDWQMVDFIRRLGFGYPNQEGDGTKLLMQLPRAT